MARRTKLVPRLQSKLYDALKNGSPIKAACASQRLSENTHHTWRKRGEADEEAGLDTVWSRFVEAMDEARALAEIELVVNPHAEAARKGDLKAGQFLAVHQFGWKSVQVVEHSGGTTVEFARVVVHEKGDEAIRAEQEARWAASDPA